MDRQIGPFQKDFTPVLAIGQFARLMPIGKFYRVIYSEGIPMHDYDFGAFTAGQTKTDQELSDLYMPENELAQYRFIPIDDVQVVAFYQPRKRPKWITKAVGGKLTRALDYANPIVDTYQLTEFFQFEDTKAFVDLYSAGALATSILRFYGIRYVLEEVPRTPVFTTLWYESYRPMVPRPAAPPAR